MSKYHNPESVVLLDVDGVLGNFVGQMIKMLGAEDRISPEDITSFHVFSNSCFTSKEKSQIKQMWATDEFWATMPVYPLAREAYKWLKARGWNPVFASAAMPTYGRWRATRVEWLKANISRGIEDGDLLGGSQKYLIRGHTLFEDKLENAERWAMVNERPAMLINRPYNQGSTSENIKRISWEDVLSDNVAWL